MYIKNLLVFLIFTVAPAVVFAGNTLSGRVLDARAQPLYGAIIEINDLKTGAVTDSNGHFFVDNLPKGTFTVEVHYIGYATSSGAVAINGDTRKDFILNENIIEKNEVVVTGASLATSERKSITPIQSMSLRQMEENTFTNVIDAITNLPGVSALSTGPAISKPVIRGLGYNRIITLSDGVRQEGQQWGDEHGIEIDDYNVTRIEVLKGPASLAFGSDALAGVVNIISDPQIAEGHILGNVMANYQTNDGLGALHADMGGKKDGFTWYGYITEKQAHDYHNRYDGYVFDTRFKNTNYGASFGVNKSWGSSKLSFTVFDQQLGIAEGNRDSLTGSFLKDVLVNGQPGSALVPQSEDHSYAMTTPHQRIQHYKLVWENDLYLDNGGRLAAILGYQRNIRQEFADIESPSIAGLSLLLQTATYDLKYYFPQQKGWHVTTGINGMTQANMNRGNEFLVPNYDLFDGGIYAIANRDWDKWSVSGGLRLDTRYLDSKRKDYDQLVLQNGTVTVATYQLFYPFTDKFTNFSGSIGAAYNFNKNTTFKFNFSSGFRSPNIAELASNGVHDGTFRYEFGNVNLVPEKSYQADMGVSWSKEHIFVNVSLFDNFIADFIYIRKLSGADSAPIVNDPNGYPGYKYAQSNANLYGGEVNIDYHPHPFDWLHLENTLSYVRGLLMHKVDGTDNLPGMPPLRWVVNLKAQKKTLGKRLKNVYARVGLDNNFEQNHVFTAYGTETPADGYTILDAGIGGDILNREHKLLCTLTLNALNVGDVAYQNALSRLRYAPENYVTGRTGMYNMGRNFSMVLSVPLNVK